MFLNYFIHSWHNVFNYKGRATRAEFISFVLITFAVACLIGWLEWVIFSLPFGEGYFTLFYAILNCCPFFTLVSRRLHDLNKSIWWQLVLWIPLIFVVLLKNKDFGLFWLPIGIYLFVMLYYALRLLLTAGDESKNQYGERPEIQSLDKKQFIILRYQQLKCFVQQMKQRIFR